LLFILPLILFGFYAAQWLGPLFEYHLLGGDYRTWLMDTLNEQYDQRNSIVVGFAMGFAVIPIIFTICEDALSSVPSSLTSASLALGATRWQTATRVVLPSASPGIFSAVMIGFGRAVGETMIVLMATGNTPILSFSPFNGMRTLSANIAVEIPEAPYQGTLYRVLFLAATLLFILTFIINTAAEIVRQRLRKKYAEL
jgi:phosphate transport system permease protein